MRETADLLGHRINELKAKTFKVNDSFFEGDIAQEDRDLHIQQIDKSVTKAEKELIGIETQIAQLAEQLTSKKSIEYFAKNFCKNIDKLNYEQKCLLVKICVKKIEVHETDNDLKVVVHFAFAKPKQSENKGGIEPNRPHLKKDGDDLDQSSQLDGAEFGKGYIWLQSQCVTSISVSAMRQRVSTTGKVYFEIILP